LQKCDDDEEDLEALRLAALQTLGCNKPATNTSNHLSNTLYQPQQISGLGRGFRGGRPCTQPGRNVSIWLDKENYFMNGLSHYYNIVINANTHPQTSLYMMYPVAKSVIVLWCVIPRQQTWARSLQRQVYDNYMKHTAVI
jgi:hypothetical protein